ncbi:quinone oxidoreductase family protein [Nesterenkonia haasae]|uniref:quinone oxidoreductase family protein n=1 Tax=Nesterenkonia haasae TaxID=2587813 RepID=UPI0013920550|nr:zinc-binding dehydrogenase [Nesterenkonia haasae]NDK31790.1 zinc-binding dehydrogenase [Nesterenkonia haasae]
MTHMRAFVASPETPTPVLTERALPQPGADEVLVRVEAVALNNADLAPVTAEQVAGYEFAGEIADVGSTVDRALIGNRVMGISSGAFAEYATAHHTHVAPIPDRLDPTSAAALPISLITEYGALRAGGLRSGDTVLITAASSGIAALGVQIARALGAGVVIGTTRSASRTGLLERAGVDHAIVTDGGDLAEQVSHLTGGRGVDLVLDHVGGRFVDPCIQSARIGGAVISVGRLASPTAEVSLFPLAKREVLLRSVSYGLTPATVMGGLFSAVSTHLLPAIIDGRVTPVLDGGTWSFAQLPEALTHLREGRAEGKVIISVKSQPHFGSTSH